MKNKNPKKYIIGVDGGGTKTLAVLADLQGKILKKAKTGPSNPRNIGVEKSVLNLAQGIKKVIKDTKKDKIISIFVALPAIEEEYKFKKKKIKAKLGSILKISQNKISVASDQIIAFKSGTDKKNGIVLIAGTGCVAHGWRGKKQSKISGWGYLGDEGSAFWAGQKTYQAILKDLGGRGAKTLITKLVFRKLKIKNKESFVKKIYSNPTKSIPLLTIFTDEAAIKKDKIACNILKQAGQELALAVNTVIKKLNFQKQSFPLVLVGSMFKSKILLDTVKKEVKKTAPKAEFIRPKNKPVAGAVKLAIEQIPKQ
ncbi:hypothetical protein KAS79_01445 [Candidatus Parcubacteria bacterium]|nr:hypothetical protein [Candidatus Parcubacteria bacterium]